MTRQMSGQHIMDQKRSDIESVILAIERATIVANDGQLDRAIREDALVHFVRQNADTLLDLLAELKDWREKTALPLGGGSGKTHRVILEGFSEDSGEKALSAALDKAAHYFSEDHDVSITIQQLIELPNGGHRATLEVHITPFSQRNKAHIQGQDVVLKRDRATAFAHLKDREENYLHHLIFDHFSALTGHKANGHIPESFLINVTDAKLMHYLLEKQFLRAEMAAHMAEKGLEDDVSEEAPHHILVKLNHE